MEKTTLREFLSRFDTAPGDLTREEFLEYEVKFGHPWEPESGDVSGDMEFLDVTYDPEKKEVIISISPESED